MEVAKVREEGAPYGRSPAFRRKILEIYDHQCAAGRSAIFSMCRSGERCLTVELSLPGKRVVQVRGVCNSLPSADEQAIVDRWAQTLPGSMPGQ